MLDENRKKLMDNLQIQYDNNLTGEQKRVLIRYSSSLFIFYNNITAIEEFENKSIDELYDIMKDFISHNSFIIKNMTLFINGVSSCNYDLKLREILLEWFDEDILLFDDIIERNYGINPPDIFDKRTHPLDEISFLYKLKQFAKLSIDRGLLSESILEFNDEIGLRNKLEELPYKTLMVIYDQAKGRNI